MELCVGFVKNPLETWNSMRMQMKLKLFQTQTLYSNVWNSSRAETYK